MLDKLNDPNYCFQEEDDGVDDIDIDDGDNDGSDNGDDDPDIEKQLALEFKALELDNMTSNEKHVTSDEYKARAKTAMQNGKQDEALRLMKLAKEQLKIEQGISNPSSLIRSHSSRSNDSNSPRSKRYNQKPSTVPPVKAIKSPPSSSVQKATTNKSFSSSSPSPHVPISSPINYDSKKVSTPLTPSLELSWSLLVAALEEAIDQCKNEALELGKQGKKAEAIPFMAKLKEYQKELDTAKSRLIVPGARPVLWRWQNETIQKTHENVEMGDDQIQVVIDNAVDMGLSLQPYEGCLVTCEYNLGVPKDSPIIGKAEGKIKAGVVSFQLKTLFKVTLKRGSQSLLGSFSRRSATFTLSLQKKGFFSNTIIPLGIATMPLNGLLNKCECGGRLMLYSESEGRNRSAVPGAIEAYLRLRRPIDKPDVIVTTRSTLILDDWSTVDSTSSTPVIPNASPIISGPSVSIPQPIVSQTLPPPQPSSRPVEAKHLDDKDGEIKVKLKPKVDFSTLTDEEKSDPFSPLIIRSNKALEQDIEEETAKLATASGENRLNCQIRLDGLNMQMGRLISAVQDESLSIPIYIQMLQRGVERDKKLALYFNTLQCADEADAAENKDTALRLLKRSKVIAEELKEFENMKEDDI